MNDFLDEPGSDGPFGALLDEYARAAEGFCAVAETFEAERFARERPSDDPDTRSPRTICLHVVRSAFGYAARLARALGDEGPFDAPATTDVRAGLALAIRRMETVVEPMRAWPDERVMALKFEMSWGPVYSPEILLEHAICHLLRHRRQLERWRAEA